jgi:hypothetical protein
MERLVESVDGYSIIVGQLTTVPPGKLLTITFVTADIRVEDTAELLHVYLYCKYPRLHDLLPTKVFDRSAVGAGANTLDRYAISQPAGLVAEPGEEIWVVASKHRNAGKMQAAFYFFGYLEDV